MAYKRQVSWSVRLRLNDLTKLDDIYRTIPDRSRSGTVSLSWRGGSGIHPGTTPQYRMGKLG